MLTSDAASEIRRQIEVEAEKKIRLVMVGRSGVGKSCLINAITGAKEGDPHYAKSSIQTDTTTKEEKYEWNGLYLVDLPGFDTMRFPSENYFEKFQLHTFDVLICVHSGRILESDVMLFNRIVGSGKPFIIVRSMWDSAKQKGKTKDELAVDVREDVVRQFGMSLPVLFVSVDPEEGLDKLQDEIRSKLDGAKKVLYAARAKAYSPEQLLQKKKACEKQVYLYAGLSAASALIPIPGAGVAVDLMAMVTLFKILRDSFGVSEVDPKEIGIPLFSKVASRLVDYTTKEGAMLLLRQYAKSETVKEVGKYIPFVGQAVAAGLGFMITRHAGMACLNDCYILAEAALEKKVVLG